MTGWPKDSKITEKKERKTRGNFAVPLRKFVFIGNWTIFWRTSLKVTADTGQKNPQINARPKREKTAKCFTYEFLGTAARIDRSLGDGHDRQEVA